MTTTAPLSETDVSKINALVAQTLPGFEVVAGRYDIFGNELEPTGLRINLEIDNNHDFYDGRIEVTIDVQKNASTFSLKESRTGGNLGMPQNVFHSYAARLNTPFRENVVRSLRNSLTELLRSKPVIVSSKPVDLFSVYNPTQKMTRLGPLSVKGWRVVGEVTTRFGGQYLRIRNPAKQSTGAYVLGYRPVHVILV